MAGRGAGGSPAKGKPTRLRGLFADGVWMCNCIPRLPAEHFQTKNGGVNHGRWFYTCQKSQPRRCNFFLWEDDAKPREANVLLNNVRGEGEQAGALIASSSRSSSAARPSTPDPDRPTNGVGQEMYQAAEKVTRRAHSPETPRKEPRRDEQISPGSKSSSTMTSPAARTGDVFATPATQRFGAAAGLITPGETPAARRFQAAIATEPPAFNLSPARLDSELSKEILDQLRDLPLDLTDEAVAIIKAICAREARKAQGIERGRDVARTVVKEKDIEITKLKAKITALEGERENFRTIITHLRKERREET